MELSPAPHRSPNEPDGAELCPRYVAPPPPYILYYPAYSTHPAYASPQPTHSATIPYSSLIENADSSCPLPPYSPPDPELPGYSPPISELIYQVFIPYICRLIVSAVAVFCIYVIVNWAVVVILLRFWYFPY
ncbi:Protein of unknown function [Pyronema omphalodes CBS 100304]|uniref:Uncharacterized protein n=1 Tax=Pyronema omphalodes (strain CBS 100304) TaxID=1076935 RepID=U4L9Z0_PYROM|nr:Protein of unknown function [Pyronema omphalodes CBS 100304]